MSWRVKSTTVNALVILTLVVIGLTLAGKVFDSRIDAVGPTEPPGDPSDTIHPWEARQDAARLRSEEVVPLVKEVLKETPSQRRIRLGDEVPQLKDLKFSYFLLNNPLIKKEENLYGTVRFMHKKHAAFLNDCFI